MKTKLLLLLLFVAFNSAAQKLANIEFSGRPYILVNSNTLKDFERADAQFETKIKALGYKGSETFYTVFSPKSEISFSKELLPKIIIKMDDNIDPSDVVKLSKAVIKKDRRRFILESQQLLGKARDISDAYIKLDFKKLEDNVYEVILPKDIEIGEYAFLPINASEGNALTSYRASVKITCFSIY
jgi:hypothetical protein